MPVFLPLLPQHCSSPARYTVLPAWVSMISVLHWMVGTDFCAIPACHAFLPACRFCRFLRFSYNAILLLPRNGSPGLRRYRRLLRFCVSAEPFRRSAWIRFRCTTVFITVSCAVRFALLPACGLRLDFCAFTMVFACCQYRFPFFRHRSFVLLRYSMLLLY